MTPITVRQKLMQYLYDNIGTFPPKKDNLVEATDSTPSNVANELAILIKNNYVSVSKGNYTITPAGRAAYEEDPMLSMLKNGKETNSLSPNNSIEALIDWDYINNSYVCYGLFEARFSEGFDPKKLLPIVFLYLKQINYPLPIKPSKPEKTSTSDREIELLIDYMTKLVETCG